MLLVCALVSGLLGGAVGAYVIFSQDLPKIPDLRAYRPKTVSKFHAEDGTLIGLFYREKRFPMTLDSIPPHVINAFLAAEDARFFSHTGVDWIGVTRALVKNLSAGNFAQGGSTVTQQVTRNFLLSKEKRLSRKIREALLAVRLEKTLTKNEILELYLNEIYLGKGSYGVESASATYFGKTCAELTVPEAALLAGLVSNPSRYSPFKNLDACLKRREFVLGSMLRGGFITEADYRAALSDTPRFRENLPNPFERVPHFTEAVRRYIVDKYGENRLYDDGLQVWTTCDLPLHEKASEVLLKGATAWEKRQGRPAGLVRRLKAHEAREFLQKAGKRTPAVGEIVQAVVLANHTRTTSKGKKLESKNQDCTLALQSDLRFRMELESGVPYKPNDLLQFRVAATEGSKLSLEHQGLPIIEGALVCIENRTGYVRALVGGLDFERSSFNRALQAVRQPGSAFKPLVFASALEWFNYSPRTLVLDEPIAVVIDQREPEWIPSNADGNFMGPITLRQALAHSRNIASVKLIMDVGVPAAIEMTRNLGITTPMGKNLAMSLGVSEVSPLELTSAYTVFPNAGVKVHPVLVKKVVDRFGNVLEDNTGEYIRVEEASRDTAGMPLSVTALEASGRIAAMERPPVPPLAAEPPAVPRDPEPKGLEPTAIEQFLLSSFPSGPASRPEARRALSARTAYLMVSMMRETCVRGTAAAAARLGRKDLAGKTGTTDDSTDAWFVGFNPRYTVGVWVGYDAKVSLGRQEHGSVAALPVWMDFMKEALRGQPSENYPIPPGIVFVDDTGVQRPERVSNPLEAEPDLIPDAETRMVSLVDELLLPVAGYYDAYMSHSQNPIYTPMMYPRSMGAYQAFPGSMSTYQGFPGSVRVLSPAGRTLGHADLARDDKGKAVLNKETFAPFFSGYAEESPGEASAEGFFSDAGRFMRVMPRYAPPLMREGWVQ